MWKVVSPHHRAEVGEEVTNCHGGGHLELQLRLDELQGVGHDDLERPSNPSGEHRVPRLLCHHSQGFNTGRRRPNTARRVKGMGGEEKF